MLRTLTTLAATTAVALSAATAPAAAQNTAPEGPTLKLGDPAPAMTIDTWVKGDPITEFKDGQVYVVEFWATWCKPCIDAFPHLTKLQKEYEDKATIIGVNIWENAKGAQRVSMIEDFVEKQGDRMGYAVAIESGTSMADSWMTAAGRRGIPSAFIVDQQGKVAWMGHPMGMDRPLAQIVSGEFSTEDAQRMAAADAERDAKAARIMTEVNELWEQDKKAQALDKLDDVVGLDPDEYGSLAVNKLELLMASPEVRDIPAAHAYAKRMHDSLTKDNAQALNGAAWMLLTAEEGTNPELALALAKRANALTEGKEAAILDTLAKAQFDTGNKAAAIATQTRAVDLAEGSMREELKAALEIYQAAE